VPAEEVEVPAPENRERALWLRNRDELTNHIQRLCLQHDIDIIERIARGGWARKLGTIICVRPVKTERTHIIALHEIGHIIGRNRSGR
jgi:hypothetical protein